MAGPLRALADRFLEPVVSSQPSMEFLGQRGDNGRRPAESL
jgi:hypothetical protein